MKFLKKKEEKKKEKALPSSYHGKCLHTEWLKCQGISLPRGEHDRRKGK